MPDPSLERTFRGHKSCVTSVAFSPSLKHLASSSGDHCIMLWNYKPQLRAFRFIGHQGVVTAVQFSPEGDILASASKDKTVRLWVPSAKGESITLKGHMGAVRSVDFSKDSRHLLTGSDDKTAKLWSMPSRKFVCSLVGHSNWIRSAVFSPESSSTLAATAGDDKVVKLWDLASHQCLHSFYDHSDAVNTVAFHPDGNCLASGSQDHGVNIWDVRSRQLIQHYPAHSDSVGSVSFHPSGNYLLSVSTDSSLRLWDLREGRLLYTLHGHAGAVHSGAFSGGGNFFASGGADRLVMVWRSNLSGSGPLAQLGPGGVEEDPEGRRGGLMGEVDWSGETYMRQPRPVHGMDVRQSIDESGSNYAAHVSQASTAYGAHAYMSRTPIKPSPLARKLHTSTRESTTPQSASQHSLLNISRSLQSPLTCKGVKAPEVTGTRPPSRPSSQKTTALPPKQPKSYLAADHQPLPQLQQEPLAQHPPTRPLTELSEHQGLISRTDLPPPLAHTLEHIVGQLNLIAHTMSLLDTRLCMTEEKIASIVEHLRTQQGRDETQLPLPESILKCPPSQQIPTNHSPSQTHPSNITDPLALSTRTNTISSAASSAPEFGIVKLEIQPPHEQYQQTSQNYTCASYDSHHFVEDRKDQKYVQADKELSSHYNQEQYGEYVEGECQYQPVADATGGVTFDPLRIAPTLVNPPRYPPVQTTSVDSARLAPVAPPLPILISTKYEPKLTDTIATILSARGLTSSQTQQDPPMSSRKFDNSSILDPSGIIYQNTTTGVKYQDNIGKIYDSMVDQIRREEIERGEESYDDLGYDEAKGFQVEEEEGEGLGNTRAHTGDWGMDQNREFENEDGYEDDKGHAEFEVERDE